jgi:hypothetical protein
MTLVCSYLRRGGLNRAPRREWFISSSEAADFGPLETVPVADGDDEYSFKVPEEHSMKFPPMHTRDKDIGLTMGEHEIILRGE